MEGIGEGVGFACGTNNCRAEALSREIASAAEFWTPGICLAHRSWCARVWSWEDPEFTDATTAWLSDRNRTRLPAYWGPQTAAAITMGTSSFAAM